MKIGLALGGGAARGWAHIGVINALAEKGIKPDIVCGTSIGALVGAAYAAGNIDKLTDWVNSLTKLETAKFFNINTSFNGFIKKDKLHDFFCHYVVDDAIDIEQLDKQFASVATDLHSGREIWLQSGKVTEAVWASIGLPGLFPPMRYKKNQWLLDGGLVNPVPVSVCRALGADFVIAVNLNGDLLKNTTKSTTGNNEIATENWLDKVG
jgi:NTE family protein